MAQGSVPYDAEQTRAWLRSHGKRLWKEFVPEELQRQFWQHQDRIKRMLIISKGDPVPWELLYPHLRGTSDDAGFLAEQFPIGRWRYGPGPSSRLSLNQADFVEPAGSPPRARQEIESIRRLIDGSGGKTHDPISELSDLLELFKGGSFNLLHFACHNTFNPRFSAASTIDMGTRPFQPIFLEDYDDGFSRNAPLVFLNACRSDAEAALYTELAGWASAFLGAGVGAFIGSLWEVRDETACTFAQEFYGSLLNGGNLGQAMGDAREAVRDRPGDPTWLAYTLYGDPAAQLA